jgi:tRNA pseudouridine55 synthase
LRGRKNKGPELSGLLLVDKPSGPTSHDLVDGIRRLSGQRSVGHVGTLDPMATGLMGLLLGSATKLEPWLVKLEKLYLAEVILGLATETLDTTGAELFRHPGPYPDEATVLARLANLTGDVLQVPPAYSAIKVGGRVAHRAARAGKPLDLAPRAVTAFELKLLSWRAPVADIEARVSTGYYVRSLARDLGEAVGLGGGALSALRRLRVGDFDLSAAGPPPESREELQARLVSPREALSNLPEITLALDSALRLASGAPVPAPPSRGRDLPAEGTYKIIGPGGDLLALAELARPEGDGPQPPRRPILRPLRVLGSPGDPPPHARQGE